MRYKITHYEAGCAVADGFGIKVCYPAGDDDVRVNWNLEGTPFAVVTLTADSESVLVYKPRIPAGANDKKSLKPAIVGKAQLKDAIVAAMKLIDGPAISAFKK